jgi:hypothetical protein
MKGEGEGEVLERGGGVGKEAQDYTEEISLYVLSPKAPNKRYKAFLNMASNRQKFVALRCQ